MCFTGEATLTDALTAAGKTYEEIAGLFAEQVPFLSASACHKLAGVRAGTNLDGRFASPVWFLLLLIALYNSFTGGHLLDE